jgi:hypothetical protein
MKPEFYVKSLLFGILLVLSLVPYAVSPDQLAVGQSLQDQTAASAANLTATDFNPVRENLVVAREGVFGNDSSLAYNAINAAAADLFGLTQDSAGNDETLLQQLTRELRQVQSPIDNARDAMREGNNTQALRFLNNAELRLFNVVSGLPSGESPGAE